MLQVSSLQTRFTSGGDVYHAVRGVDFTLPRGQTLVLVGESGSGKSSLARSIMCLNNADQDGSVALEGRELTRLRERDLRRVRGGSVGLIPQDPVAALDPLRSVGRQLAEVVRVHRSDVSRGAAREHVLRLLKQVGIADPEGRIYRSRPHELSGGLCQRVAIAASIAPEPSLLIADEPTTALDVSVQAEILNLLADLQRSRNMALLFITHDVNVARELGGRIVVMYAGRVVEEGLTADVLSTPVHPYTQGLVASTPDPQVERGQLETMPGSPPPANRIPTGCALAPRCSIAVPECSVGDPPSLREIPSSREHYHACDVRNRESENTMDRGSTANVKGDA